MFRWFLLTLIGVSLMLMALVGQLVAVVICSEGDPTLILCSMIVGNSVTTTMLVFWCQYTGRVLRDHYWRQEIARDRRKRDA